MKEPEVEVVDEHGNVLNKKKSFNKHLIMTTVIYLIIGLALLLAPGAALVSICYVTGSICLAYSVYLFVIYFRQKERNYYDPGFLFPIVMLGVGLFVIFGAGLIIQILPMIFWNPSFYKRTDEIQKQFSYQSGYWTIAGYRIYYGDRFNRPWNYYVYSSVGNSAYICKNRGYLLYC